MSETGNSILKSMTTLLEEKIKSLHYDKTFKSTVKNNVGWELLSCPVHKMKTEYWTLLKIYY